MSNIRWQNKILYTPTSCMLFIAITITEAMSLNQATGSWGDKKKGN